MIIFLAMVIACVMMFTSKEAQTLSEGGIGFLKYFTTQSNILIGLASLLSFIYLLIKKDKYPLWLATTKMVATTAVFVTFITVMVWLGPIYGYPFLLSGANLFMHLLIPVASIAQFLTIIPHKEAKFVSNCFSMIPVFLYGVFYLSNLAANNGYGNVNYDWYQFGRFGIGFGILIFMGMLAICFGLSVALYYLNKLIKIVK